MSDDRKKLFVQLLLKSQGTIRPFIASLVRDYHAREDVFQDVAMILYEKFDQYDKGRSFAAWARGIAANVVMKQWGRDKRAPAPFSPETVEQILAAYDELEDDITVEQDALEHCMQFLPDRSRALLAYRYEQTLSLGDIAERMMSTLGAIHKALARIRDKLRECIERRLATARRT